LSVNCPAFPTDGISLARLSHNSTGTGCLHSSLKFVDNLIALFTRMQWFTSWTSPLAATRHEETSLSTDRKANGGAGSNTGKFQPAPD
jgi:hypothetical protein